MTIKKAIKKGNASVEIISKYHGMKNSANNGTIETDKTHITTASVLYDAVFIPGGRASVEKMMQQGDALHFILEAYKHYKPIGATGEGVDMLRNVFLKNVQLAVDEQDDVISHLGVVTVCDNSKLDDFAEAFTRAIAWHRHWEREGVESIPA
ncbi:MAG: DJ-1/PfpI family protein [Saprospiraceae bacterium]